MTWELLDTAPNSMEAALIKGLLESVGIPVRLEGESLATLYGLTVGHLARVKIFVPSDQLSAARGLLETQLTAPMAEADDSADPSNDLSADDDPSRNDG